MAKNKLINLIPQEEFETSTLGRTLRWAMTSFRVIVIVTETFVMGGFLSRFWLDQQRSNLDELIKTKSVQISTQIAFEKEFRGYQRKLSIVKDLTQLPKSSTRVQTIASKLTPNILLSSITLSDTTATIRGAALSESEISQFIANLRAESTYKDIEITQVGISQENPLITTFGLNLTY